MARTVQAVGSRSAAAVLAQGLLAAMAGVALWIAWGLAADLRRSQVAYGAWPRVPAQVTSLAEADVIEFEVAEAALAALGPVRQPEVLHTHAPEHTRILLPAPPLHGLGVGDAVDLAVPPDAAAPVLVLDPVARFAPPAGALLWLALIGWGALGLHRSRWGADLLWTDGRWAASPPHAVLPGARAAAPALAETEAARRKARRWSTAFGGVFAAAAAATPLWWGAAPIMAGVVAIVCLILLMGVIAATIEEDTRRLWHDAGGIAVTTWLQTRRIPWSAIGGVEHVDLNRAAREAHARVTRNRYRLHRLAAPRSAHAWRLVDTAGRPIIDLAETMAPSKAFDALLTQAAARARGAAT